MTTKDDQSMMKMMLMHAIGDDEWCKFFIQFRHESFLHQEFFVDF